MYVLISYCKEILIHNYCPQWYEDYIKSLIDNISIPVRIFSRADKANDTKGYTIYSCDNTINLNASCGEMLYFAISKIRYLLEHTNDFSISDCDEIYTFPSREDYINNIDLMIPVWKYTWNPPAWLLSYDEKKASFPKANRPFCWAHRGGGTYYPENSVEAIISSINMGADVMELDFRYTKDHRIILMHYDTLHQSTDWEYKHGKNGLPDSDYIIDWTYDEICQLRLKAGRNFDSEAITEYIVPTLEDVLRVCNNRTFFIMDKMNPWEEWETIYKCILTTKCYEPFAFAYKFPEEEVNRIRKSMMEEFGKTGPYFYWRRHAGSLERECLGPDQMLEVFKQFSEGKNTNIMTNYVKELVEYIDENYKEEV